MVDPDLPLFMSANSTENKILDIGFYRYSFLNRGGDRIVVDYANHLAEQGHRITFHTKIFKTVFDVHPDIVIRTTTWPGKIGFLLTPLWFTFDHDLLLFDIIHLAPFFAKQVNVVYLAQADDVEYYGNFLARTAIDKLYRWFFRTGRPVITDSEQLTETFRRRYQAFNCNTIPIGINLNIFYPDPDSELVHSKAGRTALFFMARGDHFRKGFDIALNVFTSLDRAVHGKVELWVCGEKFDATLPFPVRQFGVVSDARLRQLLSSADIFFYPSRHEGFGLFPLEAMACGCVPVITNAIPYAGFSDCLQVAPVGDVDALRHLIVALLSEDDRLEALREKAKIDATQFDMEKSKENFCHVLNEIYLEARS